MKELTAKQKCKDERNKFVIVIGCPLGGGVRKWLMQFRLGLRIF